MSMSGVANTQSIWEFPLDNIAGPLFENFHYSVSTKRMLNGPLFDLTGYG